MELRKYFKCLIFLTVIMLMISGKDVKASNPTEVTLEVDRTYSSYDLTGNGKKDEIEIKTEKNDYGYLNKVFVVINGKRKVSFTHETVGDGLFVSAKLFTLKNKKSFLYLKIGDIDEVTYFCGIYQYKSGKLEQVIDGRNFLGKAGKYGTKYGSYAIVKKVQGNMLVVDFYMNSYTLGPSYYRYQFIYKNGTLKCKNLQSVNINNSSYKITTMSGSKSKVTVAEKIKVYTKPDGKKVSYILKKGEKVKLLAAYIKSEKFFLKIKSLKKGKIGWIKCLKKLPSSGNMGIFEELGSSWSYDGY